MDVKPGYKRTEVGVIPEDWEVLRLNQLADIRSGGTPNTLYSEYWDGDVLWCTPTDITGLNGYKYLKDTSRKITVLGLKMSSAEMIPPHSVVMTSRATIGECAVNVFPLCTNQGFKNFVPFENVGTEFLYYLLSTQKQSLISLCGGSTFLEIGKAQLAKYQISLPASSIEQQAIAEALSDADALIESLEQLLAKKRRIKQGVMQELLTGERRLPGFCGKWLKRAFGDLVSVRSERIDPKKEKIDFCIELEHIDSTTGLLNGYGQTNEKSALKSVFYPGDVLFGKLRAYLRKYWLASRGGVCSTEIWCFYSKGLLKSNKLLFQLVQMKFFIESASIAYGTHMPRSDWNTLKKLIIAIPEEEKEQTAVAAVLSDLDADIAALDARIGKTRQLKQGMMQELLTGRIRLL